MLLSIQYSRALAALMVVFVHTFGGFGAQGVDVFFILSGYIMMYIMYKNHRGALEFFLARFFRVAPIYYMFTLLALILGNSNDPTIEHIIHSLLFLKLKWSSPVLSIGWTLEYEFVFYVVCALVLTLQIGKRARTFLIVVVLILLSILLDVIFFPQKAYGHFVEFIFGIATYFLTEKIKAKFDSWKHFLTLFFVAVLSLASLYMIQIFVYPDDKLPFRFLGYGVLSWIFCLSMILMEPKIPKFKSLSLLGDASYSIYISHTTTLYVYYKLFGIERYHSALSDFVSFIVVIILGVVVHKKIEKPIASILSAKRASNKMLASKFFNRHNMNWLARSK